MKRNVFIDTESYETSYEQHLGILQQEKNLLQAVDFCGIFNVLYELFKKLGVLNEDSIDTQKLSFRLAYPDYEFTNETESAVVFDLHTRKRLELDTSVGKIKQEKPRELVSQKDIVTGQIKTISSYTYENNIALTVGSTSIEKLYQLVQYIETVLTQYSGYLQKYFRKVIYLGMTSDATAPNLFKNRMVSRTLHIQIITEEMFTLLHEEIQDIKTQHVNPNYFKG
jgi:hypothetical protein